MCIWHFQITNSYNWQRCASQTFKCAIFIFHRKRMQRCVKAASLPYANTDSVIYLKQLVSPTKNEKFVRAHFFFSVFLGKFHRIFFAVKVYFCVDGTRSRCLLSTYKCLLCILVQRKQVVSALAIFGFYDVRRTTPLLDTWMTCDVSYNLLS